jgi:DinB superfamily
MQRPQPGEYNNYFKGYIDQVPEGDFLDVLYENTRAATAFFEGIAADKHNYRYAEDKWSIKELLVHIADAERVFCYRALVAARGDDKTLLCSMDDHLYLRNAIVAGRLYDDVVAEFKAIRAATEKLFESLPEKQSIFRANTDAGPITARALGYIIIGHTAHHVKVIKERYL